MPVSTSRCDAVSAKPADPHTYPTAPCGANSATTGTSVAASSRPGGRVAPGGATRVWTTMLSGPYSPL
jgi:hypothetical protein